MNISQKIAPFYLALALGLTATTQAQDVGDVITDGTERIGNGVTDFISARNPLNVVEGAVNDFGRTVQGITTVKGKVDTKVTVNGDILQTIEGGTGNVNKLDLGSVSGGAYVDGQFTSIVELGGVKQTITGSNSTNRASIGSVTK